MAEPGRTVRVSGLPTDIEDDKLRDKLFIHFLRDRNGGGEIDAVIIVKATPASALITFEDSRVAQRVIHRGRHTLDIDGKTYKLAVAEHHEKPDPDRIILELSATIRYHQLPGGILALTNICKNHRDVELNYIKNEKCCVISGAYSKVQAILAQLLGPPEGFRSADHNSSSEAALGGSMQQKTVQQEPEHPKTKPHKQKERNRLDKTPVEHSPRSDRDLTPGGYDWEDTGQRESAAEQPPSPSVEDFSLVVDADMFQYLQRHCQDDYQNILSQYDVKVVDLTTQGVTTLFLDLAAKGPMRDGINEREHLMMAKNALSMFYQQNEIKIRRAQVPKVILPSGAELKRVIEALCSRHPRVLLNEDEENLYLIGNSSDVSEAKQFLLLDHSKARDKRADGAADLKFSSYASGLSTHADERRVPLTPLSSGGFLDEKSDPFLKRFEDESRAEGAGRHKIAARFGDLGPAALGSRTTDFTSRAKPSSGRQSRPGPMLGHDVLSETSKMSGETVSRAAAQNTGADILFTGGSSLSSFASVSNKTSLRPEAVDVRPKTSPVSTTQTSLSGSTVIPPAGSGTALKRASSFSGTSQKKPQLTDQSSEETPGKPKVRTRGRSSSFSSQTPRERQEVHSAELTVSAVNWLHIKEAYKARLDDLTSDVQMTEKHSDYRRDVVLVIRGASSSKVDSCQTALQKLVDSVSSNFSVQELTLSELGVSDEADETLQACCSEVRNRFRKVTIQILKGKIYFLGPEQLCSQVCASLREVFSGGLKQKPSEDHSSSLFTPQLNSAPSIPTNKDQSASPHFNTNSQVAPESKAAKADGTGRNKDWQTTYRNDFCEKEPMNGFRSPSSIRNDPVMKEKAKTTDPAFKEGPKTNSLENDSGSGRFNGVKPAATWSESQREVPSSPVEGGAQEPADNQSVAEESRSGQEGPAFLCVLCESKGKPVTTKCGLTMCSTCQKSQHNTCTVCQETETKAVGIQGHMNRKKLSISLPGYLKYSTVMITYVIPDGVQGDRDPFPGKPFRGGVFTAYLPDCQEAKKLLPRLDKAFRRGLTFTVTGQEREAKVTWDCIPHKTGLQGGKSQNGYPDSTYLKRLSEVLTQQGIEE